MQEKPSFANEINMSLSKIPFNFKQPLFENSHPDNIVTIYFLYREFETKALSLTFSHQKPEK